MALRNTKTELATVQPGGAFFLPAVIQDAGDQAAKRFIEFFTANIRNPNTRQAYARAARDFFAWCDAHGLTLDRLQPVVVASYIETLQTELSAPSVKQHLAAIRMLFDWLVVGQVLPMNPASFFRYDSSDEFAERGDKCAGAICHQRGQVNAHEQVRRFTP